MRTYLFEETGEMLPYAVFVSSKLTKDSKKIPLVIALHGRGAEPTIRQQGVLGNHAHTLPSRALVHARGVATGGIQHE